MLCIHILRLVVFISVSFFVYQLVCLLVSRITQKNYTQPIFIKIGEKVGHGPRKKRSDFDRDLDHVIRIELGGGVTVAVSCRTPQH